MSALSRDAILPLIPHAGEMCLLDEVLDWSTDSINCRSRRYAGAANPLRRADGTLGSATAVEIAAQAMALHARLTAPQGGPPTQGLLAALRDVHLAAPLLEDSGPLNITATRLLGDASGASYRFEVANGTGALVTGRATVLFGAAP